MNELGTDRTCVTPEALAGFIRLVDSGTISGPMAKDVFEKMFATGRAAGEIVEAEGLGRIDDEGALMARSTGARARTTMPWPSTGRGKKQTFGFLVGQVIKATGGKANPALVNDAGRSDTRPAVIEAITSRSSTAAACTRCAT